MIANDVRVPFVFVEFDSSRAFQGSSILRYKNLLIGQKTTAGTKTELQLVRLLSADQAMKQFGAGSMLHRMALKWFLNNNTSELYAIALNDNAAGVAASGAFTFTGTATVNGIINLLISGDNVPVGVVSGQTAAQIATAIVSAVNANTYLPVTASAVSGVVTFTAKNKGIQGNSIGILIDYNLGEELPTGVTVSPATKAVAVASGAGNPDISDVLDVLGDEWYNTFCCPFTDATNLTFVENELSSRFGPMRQIDGVYFTAKKATGADKSTKLSAMASFGNGRNSPHVSCFNSTDIPNSEAEVCSAYAAQIAKEGSIDPARPFQTLQLIGILPPPVLDRFTMTENNSLLFDGIATFGVDTAGAVRIQRAITMYQKNVAGANDIAYLDVNTLLTIMYLRYDFRTTILTKYPRAKLADDGSRIGPGQQVMTPKLGKAEAISIFRRWEFAGLVENISQFKNDLVCIRSQVDPNRLEWILPPDLVNQFIVGAANIQFLLQSPAE